MHAVRRNAAELRPRNGPNLGHGTRSTPERLPSQLRNAACISQARRAETEVKVWAVEKNPNAVHALRHRRRREEAWSCVDVVAEDPGDVVRGMRFAVSFGSGVCRFLSAANYGHTWSEIPRCHAKVGRMQPNFAPALAKPSPKCVCFRSKLVKFGEMIPHFGELG